MRNAQRSFGTRVGRALILIMGLVGASAAVDAILLFLCLPFFAIVVGLSNPYIGLLMFVALPFVTILGGAVAWIAYAIVNDRVTTSGAGGPHVHA